MVNAGMLLDIRSICAPRSLSSFFDYAMGKLTSMPERIRICNEIREKFARRPHVRWCGAEYESLYNSAVVQNAAEINGLAVLGRSIGFEARWEGDYPEMGYTDHAFRVYADAMTFSDAGQRKLSVLFHSITLSRATIVYVGSAPGEAWLSALQHYPNVSRVISFDPRGLVSCDDPRVIHHSICVNTPDDLYIHLPGEGNCVLIWDVRGDAPKGETRDAMILNEVSVLNAILADPRLEEHFFLVHIKINMRHITSYSLPRIGRFILQPFTLARDIFEARYFCHLRSSSSYEFDTPGELLRTSILQEMETVKLMYEDSHSIDAKLTANALTARYRRVDYLQEHAYNSSLEDIFLFTINHNPPERVITYLSEARSKRRSYIVSFFTGRALGHDPYSFPEGDALLAGLGTILDSRSIVQAKVEHLYFLLSDSMNDLFKEEEFTSETYKIRKTEYTVSSRSRTPHYDRVRHEACARLGAKFPKFPNDFSISDTLLSPSGHALRMAMEFISGNASIAMFAQKIVCNFRTIQRGYVRSRFGSEQVSVSKSTFAQVLRHNGASSTSVERSERTIWHSVREWTSGIEAAIAMQDTGSFHLEQLRAVINYLSKNIVCTSPGVEISKFYELAFNTPSPLTPPRRVRTRTSDDLENSDPMDVANALRRTLSDNPTINPVTWFTTLDPSPQSRKNWRVFIVKLRVDALMRDYVCHKAYINALTSSYPRHDSSKLCAIEIAL